MLTVNWLHGRDNRIQPSYRASGTVSHASRLPSGRIEDAVRDADAVVGRGRLSAIQQNIFVTLLDMKVVSGCHDHSRPRRSVAPCSPQPLLLRLPRPPARRPRWPRAPRLRERPYPSTPAADRHRQLMSTSAVMTRHATSCFQLGLSSLSAGTRRTISEPHPPLRVRARLACSGYAGSYRWSRHSRHVRATDYFIAAVAGSCSSLHLLSMPW